MQELSKTLISLCPSLQEAANTSMRPLRFVLS